MRIDRVLINIVADDPARTANFYQDLLGFERIYESDWFIDLKHETIVVEIGVILRGHEIVPQPANASAGGCYFTFVVDDVEKAAERARAIGATILQEPADTFYGQRRMLLSDPEGNTLDLSTPQTGG